MERPSNVQIDGYVNRRGAELFPGKAAREERRRRKEWARLQLSNASTLQHLWARQAERYGVLSLSKGKCNMHLWRSYAQESAGVCVEFDFEPVVTDSIAAWLPLSVVYADTQPTMNILDFMGPTSPRLQKEFVRRSFRTKTRQWSVEEEVLVAMPVLVNPPKVSVPKGLVSTLVLGHAMSSTHIAEILGWSPSVPVLQTNVDSAGRITGFSVVRARPKTSPGPC